MYPCRSILYLYRGTHKVDWSLDMQNIKQRATFATKAIADDISNGQGKGGEHAFYSTFFLKVFHTLLDFRWLNEGQRRQNNKKKRP